MGCGKTHWGNLLSQKLNLPFFDLDQKIVEHDGRSVSEIFKKEGEEYFRLLEKDVLHLLTENHDSFVMACGGGTPCFYNNIDYLKKKGNGGLDQLFNGNAVPAPGEGKGQAPADQQYPPGRT